MSETQERHEYIQIDLECKIRQLDKRLKKVETQLQFASEELHLDAVSLEAVRRWTSGTNASMRTPIDSGQITSMARNAGIVAEVLGCFRILKEQRFAVCQSLLLGIVLAAMVSFIIVQYSHVDESKDALYKPIKIVGQDDFYLNEELEYTIPKHYFLMHMQGPTLDIPTLYNKTFNENCEEDLASCLKGCMNNFLREARGINASCGMVAEDKETGLFDTSEIELRSHTFYVDEIDTAKWNGSDNSVFGVLLKLEFEALATYMNGLLSCSILLDISKMNDMLPEYTYEIYFLVSRTDEDSGLTGTSNYIDSWSKLWRWDDTLTKNFVYVYEESTYDKQSIFQAEIYVERRVVPSISSLRSKSVGTSLTIDTYPNPTIKHFISYNNYSYMDWLADIGGFFSIAVGFFLFTATKITKLAQRGEVFHPHQGILPIFSLPHRNVEELARLRFIVLENLGLTEDEYFGKEYQKELSLRIQDSQSRA